MSENYYLHDVPLKEARQRFELALEQADLGSRLEAENVTLDQALGRVTAQAIWAVRSAPHYHAAAMDGYALRAVDTQGASDRNPVTLQIGERAQYLDTGDPMPDWANAVAPIENVEALGPTRQGRALEAIRIRAALTPWIHVRPMGEDMVATELVLPSGRILSPVDLGALAGSGNQEAPVTRKPRVAVIPTGSELVPIETAPQAGQIIEYNSLVLAAQVESWGGRPTRWPIVADDRAAIEAAVREAAREHDLVLINAGSSAGLEDYTADVVARLGSLLVHGVAVRPGHPVVLGMLDPVPGKDLPTPIIGVPGYPVSAALTGEIFVEPLLARWLGRQAQRATQVEATMSRKVHSSLGDDEYLRVTVGKVGERLVAAPLSRGAGVISSLVRADGIVVIPAGTQGIQAGDPVQVRLYREREEIERTLVVLGSHDLTIDLMAQFLAQTGGRLVSANVGSLGGLIALRRAEAHLAGSHLLDPESGEYNLSYIRRYLPGTPVTVVGLVDRQQGLIVATGNPLQIGGLEDLNRDQISFINRQRGAGTRVLLDYNLDLKGIPFQSVNGYDREEFTHLAVAAAVASGRADCGLGIQAAAMALELDFIPLFQERYDLIIPNEHFESSQLQPLLALLEDESFRNAVQALPGYDIKPMGSIIAQLE